MYGHYASFGGLGFGMPGTFGIFFVLAVVWSLFWKGWSLWLAARRHEKIWFILLLVLNTAGILDIIYIFAIAKKSDVKKAEAKPASPSDAPSA